MSLQQIRSSFLKDDGFSTHKTLHPTRRVNNVKSCCSDQTVDRGWFMKTRPKMALRTSSEQSGLMAGPFAMVHSGWLIKGFQHGLRVSKQRGRLDHQDGERKSPENHHTTSPTCAFQPGGSSICDFLPGEAGGGTAGQRRGTGRGRGHGSGPRL